MTEEDLAKFTDWLNENNYYICERETDSYNRDYWRYYPTTVGLSKIISLYLKVFYKRND